MKTRCGIGLGLAVLLWFVISPAIQRELIAEGWMVWVVLLVLGIADFCALGSTAIIILTIGERQCCQRC